MKPVDLSVKDVSPSEWRGSSCAEREGSAKLVETEAAWEELWKRSFSSPVPRVDFSRYFAVAVFVGSRNTGGYSVEFGEPSGSASEVTLPYKIRSPKSGSFVTQALTQAYAVKLFKKTGLKVVLKEGR